MNKVFSWIQLSDIHMRTNNENMDATQMKEKLPDYIRKLGDTYDAIILTGDYRYAPDKEKNPQKVADYISRCADSAGIKDKSRIVMVPGNHDLDKDLIRELVTSSISKSYKPENGNIEEEYMKQLKGSYSFYDELRKVLELPECDFINNPHRIIPFASVNLLLLNTTVTANGGLPDYQKMIIATSYLHSSMNKVEKSKPIIAVGHHGLEWWKPEEKKYCEKYFDNEKILLYLCGHSHENWIGSYGEQGGKQVNVGCLVGENNQVDVGFAIGTLFDDGSVNIDYHKWDKRQQTWGQDTIYSRNKLVIYPDECLKKREQSEPKEKIEKVDYPFSIYAYRLLGSLGEDGIKYIWEKGGNIIESVAFNRRLKISDDIDVGKTSAYSISTSIGCQLHAIGKQCVFCGTGHREYAGELSAEEIALQCIFMAEYDSDCPSFPQVRKNYREFAFMGQGEPAFNYPAVREAILLTDYAMAMINQKVSRYIISTCGIPELVMSLIDDIKHETFSNKVTVHFSLGIGGKERKDIMPIDKEKDYHKFIDACKYLYNITGMKIGVSILLLDEFTIENKKTLSLTSEKLESILRELDSNVFRIDLCTVNKIVICKNKHVMSNEQANVLLDIVRRMGFEGKIFSSFGESQRSGCGMLDSGDDEIELVGEQPIMHFNRAVELLEKAKEKRIRNLLFNE
ncbi:MAG: metallophosphoesterase [Lachnospiraceae bacterium]